ncbi:hypothetical protein [Sulfurimonas sp.]|uniref:hypothetical protein n=1 Tax=Sulfurimonas sp. TaxID=2022749 RepID=UPI0035636C6C
MNLDNTIVIAADLESLKVYRVVSKLWIYSKKKTRVNTLKREELSVDFELIKDINYMTAYKSKLEEFSNNIGFTNKQHNLLLGKEEKSLKYIADDIKMIINAENPSAWVLAFPKNSIYQLISMLDYDVKKILRKSIPSETLLKL